MRIEQTLVYLHASNTTQFGSLSDLIPSAIITSLLSEEGIATLRRRRMSMERLAWAIIGMAMLRHVPTTQLVNQLDILWPSERPCVAPRVFLQTRQRLGCLFHDSAARWQQQAIASRWSWYKTEKATWSIFSWHSWMPSM